MTKVRKNRITYNSCSQLSLIICALSRSRARLRSILLDLFALFTLLALIVYQFVVKRM